MLLQKHAAPLRAKQLQQVAGAQRAVERRQAGVFAQKPFETPDLTQGMGCAAHLGLTCKQLHPCWASGMGHRVPTGLGPAKSMPRGSLVSQLGRKNPSSGLICGKRLSMVSAMGLFTVGQPPGREVCNPLPLSAHSQKDGQQAGLPATSPTLFFTCRNLLEVPQDPHGAPQNVPTANITFPSLRCPFPFYRA